MESAPRIAVPVRERNGYENYFAAMELAGASLTPVWDGVDADAFHGLLLPGGGDVHPGRYGQRMNGSYEPDEALDEVQFWALDAFVRAEKPVLGICRGHQIINVYFGGTLIQHLPGAADHSKQAGMDNVHAVESEPGCFLDRLYGRRFAVNSSHHQGADAPGEDICFAQRADDGVVEALYHRQLPIFGVQWHPERMGLNGGRRDVADGLTLLRWFAGLCR